MADESIRDRLRKLPFRSIVAFAARIAKRMQPLYQDATSISDFEEHEAAVNDAIMLAESFARGTYFAPNFNSRQYDRAQRAAALTGFYRASSAARAAYYAALAVKGADYYIQNGNFVPDRDCATCAAYACESATGSAYADCASIAAADLCKLEMLTAMRPAQMPRDQLGDTVDTSDFGPLGPLWPDGPPKFPATTVHEKVAVEEIPVKGCDVQIAGYIGDECYGEKDAVPPME